MAQAASRVTEITVRAAAEALIAAGIQPSIRLVRQEIGGGSMSDITRVFGQVRPLLEMPAMPQRGRTAGAMVMPAPANQPGFDAGRLAELECQLAEERGRVAELRRQTEMLTAERDKVLADLADAQVKAKLAKAEAGAANRAMAKAEEAVEREALARAAAEEQVRRINKLMTGDAAQIARLRAYLDAYGGAETLAQAERGEAPADTEQLVAVARAAQAEAGQGKAGQAKPTKGRAKKGTSRSAATEA